MNHLYDEDGVKIVMSSVQLAAVLSHDTIPEPATFSNRLWGDIRTVAGVLEFVGAGALCLAPEPTTATKAGCVVVGIHGSDTLATGLRQIMSGQAERSGTEYTSSNIARAIGTDPHTANNIALAVDIAVPIGFASWIGAARIASVRAGRINLVQHEAQAGSRLGGHTITRHVGKTEADLRARLAAEPRLRVTSSFFNLKAAERAISEGLRATANLNFCDYWRSKGEHYLGVVS